MKNVLRGLLLLVVAGCAQGPGVYNFERTRLIEGHTSDEVWDAVIDVFGERNWLISNMEKASGIITTDPMGADSKYADCGKSALFSSYRNYQGRFNVLVRANDEGVDLRVTSTWAATVWNTLDSVISGSIECVSTGALERDIYEDVLVILVEGTTP